MPYDINGQPYDPDDDGGVIKAAVAAVACILLIAVCGRIAAMQPDQADDSPTYELVLDCSNSAQMHDHGLPTKADVVEWHLQGQWGYYRDGMLYAFADLPGRAGVWDELYGIDPNPNFDK